MEVVISTVFYNSLYFTGLCPERAILIFLYWYPGVIVTKTYLMTNIVLSQEPITPFGRYNPADWDIQHFDSQSAG